MKKPNFRPEIFVRNDFENELKISVVEWNDERSEVKASIKFSNGVLGGSVLVDIADWERIKKAIDKEINAIS